MARQIGQRKSNPFGLLSGKEQNRRKTARSSGGMPRGKVTVYIMVQVTWEEFQYKFEECKLNYMY